jgi:heme/copper-type cytochrome/quinol oxidase subunit 2
VVAILLLVVIVAATVSVMLVLRRRAPEGSYIRDTQEAGAVFTVAGTAYAVLLAFVFLLAFQSYNSARTAAEQEATAVTALCAV